MTFPTLDVISDSERAHHVFAKIPFARKRAIYFSLLTCRRNGFDQFKLFTFIGNDDENKKKIIIKD